MASKPNTPRVANGRTVDANNNDGTSALTNSKGFNASSRNPPNITAAEPQSCTDIGTYMNRHGLRFGRVIGEGSYSKVRIATHYLPDGAASQRIACKIINKRRASDDFVKKFLPRELEIIKKIQHPHIVRVHDVVHFDDTVYIFMDWCDKCDLLEYIKANGNVSDSKARYYFRQLLTAVYYLHNLDLAHRDLKCENILIKSNHLPGSSPDSDTIQLSDFGFARSCRERGKRILSTTYCGSAAYASPEILQGTPYNPKLYDMWALGAILFIMLTGHMPFDESNIPKMLKSQQDRILFYPPPSDVVVTDLAKICIRRLLEPDVTRRCNIEQACNQAWVLTTDSTQVERPQTTPARQLTAKSIFETECGDQAKLVSKKIGTSEDNATAESVPVSGRQHPPPCQVTTPSALQNTKSIPPPPGPLPTSGRIPGTHKQSMPPMELSSRASEPISQAQQQTKSLGDRLGQSPRQLGTYYPISTQEPFQESAHGRSAYNGQAPQTIRYGSVTNGTVTSQSQQVAGGSYRQQQRRQVRPHHQKARQLPKFQLRFIDSNSSDCPSYQKVTTSMILNIKEDSTVHSFEEMERVD